MRRVALLISTFGYLGYAPLAPGTVGSIAGVAVYWAAFSAGGSAACLAAILVLGVSGVWAATLAEDHFGSVDPAPVVIDEVVGLLTTLALVRVTWGGVVVGFLLFRLFDVIKPYPSARLERLPGGLGIIADDVMAGLYGNAVLRGLIWVFPGLTP